MFGADERLGGISVSGYPTWCQTSFFQTIAARGDNREARLPRGMGFVETYATEPLHCFVGCIASIYRELASKVSRGVTGGNGSVNRQWLF